IFEHQDIDANLETIIYKALCVKKDVVEQDEKELGLRKILNFGHTIGHGIESYYHLSEYYHGECVAMGMLYFLGNDLKERVLSIYQKLHLPFTEDYDKEKVFALMKNDKKASSKSINIIQVNEIGKAEIIDLSFEALKEVLAL
ncbi:MAG: 3-dehydroquinate synthase, partial [Oscillospiraceae bacterium]|nr:3-dehydroquinate synthase [Oscillospiraceae bacterium]